MLMETRLRSAVCPSSQILAVPSALALAILRPSGENVTHQTLPA